MTINFYKQNNVWVFRDVLTPPNTLMMKELANERVLIMDRARRTRYQGRVDNILDADGNPYENFAALYAATEDFFNDFNEPAVIQLGIDLENGSPTKYLSEKGTMEEVPAPMAEVTYEQLVAAITGSTLIPGTQYRITDYSTTTSQADTLSAGHAFDIIVVADSTNKLNENARAVQRVGDTYFDSSKLEAWRLKYSLDNDTTRFAWADTVNGKGVIYEMIDENNNECPYDFKSIMFKRDEVYYYTFTAFENTDETIKDASIMREMAADDMIEGMTYNSMKPYYIYGDDNVYPQALNFNIFKSYYDDGSMMYMPSNNHFELNCHNNFFDGTEFTRDNSFGKDCNLNTFGNGCYSNTFGNSCSSNTFGGGCYSNTFGNECSSNTFGNGCHYNTFGNGCTLNIFGNNCKSNTFGNECSSNTFGGGCYANTFGGGCYANTFGNECSSNTFVGDCQSNTFGESCYSNTFRYNCDSNSFGDFCYSNIFGNECSSNTFGGDCQSNTFGNNCYGNNIGDLLRNVIVNGSRGSGTSGIKNWTNVTALYNKNYPIEVWGYRELYDVATTNTYRYFDATGAEVKGTF